MTVRRNTRLRKQPLNMSQSIRGRDGQNSLRCHLELQITLVPVLIENGIENFNQLA